MKRTHRAYIQGAKAILFTALILLAGACGKDDPEVVSGSAEAYWKTSSTVGAAEGASAILLTGTAGMEWSADITETSTATAWCAFSSRDWTKTTAEGIIRDGLNVLYVYYPVNGGKAQRTATITLRFKGAETYTLPLTQLSESQQNLPAFNVWSELPSLKENVNYQYVTHYALVNNQTMRNYSLCFDKTRKTALWVAYPLHSVYINGSGGRTDAWAFDPIIPIAFQPDCVERSYKGNYDRGHQLPSADRLATNELNAQTFYMTNLTPQLDRLNQDMWAKLETKVRANRCPDTLYVVTGAYFGPNAGTTTDGAGNIVPLPTNYFKVLLRTRSGVTGKSIRDCNPDELISIGFWVDQRSYGNIEPPRSICTTVTDVETKTGFSFFPQVSATVKQQNAPSQWGIN